MADSDTPTVISFQLIHSRYTGLEFTSLIPPDDSEGGTLEINLKVSASTADQDPALVKIAFQLSGDGKAQVGEEEQPAFRMVCGIESIFQFERPVTARDIQPYELTMTNMVAPMIFDFSEIIIFKMGYKGVTMPRSLRQDEVTYRGS